MVKTVDELVASILGEEQDAAKESAPPAVEEKEEITVPDDEAEESEPQDDEAGEPESESGEDEAAPEDDEAADDQDVETKPKAEPKKERLEADSAEKRKLAEELQKAQAEREKIVRQMQQYETQSLEPIFQLFNTPEGIAELQRIQEESPVDYQRLALNYQKAQIEKAQIDKHKMEYAQQALGYEHEMLVSKAPELKDPALKSRVDKAIGEFLLSKGYAREELQSFADHRAYLAIYETHFKASEAQRVKKEVEQKKVKPQVKTAIQPKPTKPKPSQEVKKRKEAIRDAALRGDVRSLADQLTRSIME